MGTDPSTCSGHASRITHHDSPFPPNRHANFDHGASPAGGFQPREIGADQASSVSHVFNSSSPPQVTRWRHPAPVVADPDQQALALAHYHNFDESCRSVFRNVVKRFLHNSIDQQLLGFGKVNII